MINILVTGAGGGVGQGIIKSLKMIKDIDINIIAADMNPLATGIHASNKSYLVPAYSSPDYLKRLIEIFDLENIQFYFPGTDVELELCSLNKVMFKEKFNVDVVVSNYEAISISNDKYETFVFLKENNFSHPKTYLPNEYENDKLEFPLILKPAIGCRSIGVGIVNNKEEMNRRLKNENGLIIQELIGKHDSEYTCTVVKYKDKISDVLILNRTLRSGDTFRARPIQDKVISKYVTNVALALGIEGSCNFQLRTDKNGTPKIFEINCRYSGTTPFCSQLGFNPVEFYLKNALSIEYNYEIDYESVVLRSWSEVLVPIEMINKLDKMNNIVPSYVKKIDLFEKNELCQK